VSSLSRKQAIDGIRTLALAPGGIPASRQAQRGIDRLEHDAVLVCEILAGLQEEECVDDEESDWCEDFRVYVFRVEMDDEVDLYVKVALHVSTLGRAQLLSYKPWGSPE
jgi:hypothetical protein